MKNNLEKDIFKTYFDTVEFEDRYISDSNIAIDVIIPVLNTNNLWLTNLNSFYREIPINNLIIGDGGCNDDTLLILEEFPRVKIINQIGYVSQGYSIKELMMNVETEFFSYLHADVFLPKGWFDSMYNYKDEYDWFECFRRMTVMFEYPSNHQHKQERSYSGSQFGRTDIMQKSIKNVIEDDFLQRNEDIIFMELIRQSGGKYAKIDDTFHYHQVSNRKGELEPDIGSVSISKNSDPLWEKKIWNMQYRGIIKYLQPKKYLINNVYLSILKLKNLDEFNWNSFRKWVKITNPIWLKHIGRKGFFLFQFKNTFIGIIKVVAKESQFGKYINRFVKKRRDKKMAGS